jgi:DNA processing protein
MEDLLYWIGLNSITGIGPRKIQLLIQAFETPRSVFHASLTELSLVEGVDQAAAIAITEGFDEIKAHEQVELAQKRGIQILTLDNPSYPAILREIYAPPPVLYVRGQIKESDAKAVAIVGTRKFSAPGKAAVLKIVQELAQAGITIVSGMARGIDSLAHQCAMDNRARTFAVLGCGVDVCYPPENKKMMERIIEQGAVVSEFPIGMQPDTFHFPRRNRIISGLARCVVVAEAGETSGALITAEYALEQGREVFALPGSITQPGFSGCNKLIQNGAGLAMNGEDVLFAMKRYFGNPKTSRKEEMLSLLLNKDEEIVFQFLTYEPVHIDALSTKCNWPSSKVLGILLGMELRGMVEQQAGKNFVKV